MLRFHLCTKDTFKRRAGRRGEVRGEEGEKAEEEGDEGKGGRGEY